MRLPFKWMMSNTTHPCVGYGRAWCKNCVNTQILLELSYVSQVIYSDHSVRPACRPKE